MLKSPPGQKVSDAKIAELQEQLDAAHVHVEQLEEAHEQKRAETSPRLGSGDGDEGENNDEADTTLGEELSEGTETKTQ